MNSELNPVRCGCGGEAKVLKYIPLTAGLYSKKCNYYVQCPDCGVRTQIKDTEAEAVADWNRAMGTEFRTLIKVFLHDATHVRKQKEQAVTK